MTDRELLELAAKAAGIKKSDAINRIEFNQWNPLTDDGDALRLAVKLKLGFKSFHGESWAWIKPGNVFIEEHGDHYEATRRAIVRAAAEIGKGMK